MATLPIQPIVKPGGVFVCPICGEVYEKEENCQTCIEKHAYFSTFDLDRINVWYYFVSNETKVGKWIFVCRVRKFMHHISFFGNKPGLGYDTEDYHVDPKCLGILEGWQRHKLVPYWMLYDSGLVFLSDEELAQVRQVVKEARDEQVKAWKKLPVEEVGLQLQNIHHLWKKLPESL